MGKVLSGELSCTRTGLVVWPATSWSEIYALLFVICGPVNFCRGFAFTCSSVSRESADRRDTPFCRILISLQKNGSGQSTNNSVLKLFQSTGDSLDDDDNEEEKCLNEAKRNTAYNEVIDADNPQTPSEVRAHSIFFFQINAPFLSKDPFFCEELIRFLHIPNFALKCRTASKICRLNGSQCRQWWDWLCRSTLICLHCSCRSICPNTWYVYSKCPVTDQFSPVSVHGGYSQSVYQGIFNNWYYSSKGHLYSGIVILWIICHRYYCKTVNICRSLILNKFCDQSWAKITKLSWSLLQMKIAISLLDMRIANIWLLLAKINIHINFHEFMWICSNHCSLWRHELFVWFSCCQN